MSALWTGQPEVRTALCLRGSWDRDVQPPRVEKAQFGVEEIMSSKEQPDEDEGMIRIKAQVIHDEAAGLILEFYKYPRRAGDPDQARLRIIAHGTPLPFGNRDIIFGQNGLEAGGGTALGGICDCPAPGPRLVREPVEGAVEDAVEDGEP